ncbi:alpha/beta hydrolase [Mycobacterium manitobense]|uniref:Alpha/beta hydrolase n=1 Tax=[Mycobacterium] manitobense TaxID=190147 RepID=A0A9X3BVQ1_9MYCO|nr:alpha/beta hydrolase [[Mycobacterium] manitobense]MCV7172053.1 alpha/beta hydrolase [[Mycobacterium] manitobense]
MTVASGTEYIDTDLGRLHVSRVGRGRPAVLWHSLFLDSRSWCGLGDRLAADRTVITIDGPSHGRSDPLVRDFSFAGCVRAAEQVLDAVGMTAPVDWVGNAWGGHVGIQLAVRRPERIRTLATIGTPAHALRPVERWTKVWPLVQLYRITGPNRLLLGPLSDALVGPESVAAQPEQAAAVMRAFLDADPAAMFHAMRSMMLHRPDMSADLARVAAPTLMIAGRDDSTGWRPADAQAVARTMPDARVVAAAGSGHSSPLLIDSATVDRALAGFWASFDQPV